MENNNKNGDSGQGPKKPLTESEFLRLVEHDLKTCYGLLHAIVSDANTLKMVNETLYGRYLNGLHKAELQAQTKIDV